MILKNGKRIDGCSDTVPIGSINPYLGTTPPFGYLLLDGSYVSKVTYPELYQMCGTTFGPETDTEFKLPDLRGVTIAGYKEGDSLFGTLGGLIGSITKSYTPAGTNTGGNVESHTLTIDEMPSHSHMGHYYMYGNNNWNRSIDEKYYVTSKYVTSTGTSGTVNGNTQDNVDPGKLYYTSENSSTYPITKATLFKTAPSESVGGDGAHNHGFTQPTFTGTTSDINVVQPTITLNWIVKAVMLIPVQASVVNTAISSTTNVYCTDYINNNIYTKEQSDNRYYTKAEIDALLAQYLPLTGGTINGNINVTGNYQVNGTPVIWEEEV